MGLPCALWGRVRGWNGCKKKKKDDRVVGLGVGQVGKKKLSKIDPTSIPDAAERLFSKFFHPASNPGACRRKGPVKDGPKMIMEKAAPQGSAPHSFDCSSPRVRPGGYYSEFCFVGDVK